MPRAQATTAGRARGAGRGKGGRGGGEGRGTGDGRGTGGGLEIDHTKHPIGIILMSVSVSGVRVSVDKSLFDRDGIAPEVFDSLPQTLYGTCDHWAGQGGKVGGKINIEWDANDAEQEGSNSDEWLQILLKPEHKFKLERHPNGQPAPKAAGMEAQRAFHKAITVGPYAADFRQMATDMRVTVVIEYDDNGPTQQEWTSVPPESITEDARPGTRFRAKFPTSFSPFQTASLVTLLFNFGIPRNLTGKMVGWLNQRVGNEPADSKKIKRQTTEGEVLRYWGYCGAACLAPGVPMKRLWARKRSDPMMIVPPLAFGEHGMTRNRFKHLTKYIAMFFDVGEADLKPDDPWRYVMPLFDLFNDWRRRKYVPSWLLTVDELMFLWLGKSGFPNDGVGGDWTLLPAVSFVPRKPDPMGMEGKVLADGCSSVTLHIEPQQGAIRHALQEFHQQYGHMTANTLRMCKAYFRTSARPGEPARALKGDSWFASLKDVSVMFYESGGAIYMGGDVKTKTAGYPTDAIVQLLPNATSGDWAVMTTDVTMPNGDVLKVFAWAHVRGPAVHTFIDTSGTTELGDPQQHKDDELDVVTGTHVYRKIPKVGNDVTKAQPVIDRNNKRRQYQLRVERRWRTQAFPFRALTSMMATCFVDTYNAHCYHNKVDIDFDEACNIMFYALMHNEVDAIAAGDRDEEDEGFFDQPAGCEECDSSSGAGSDDDDVPDAPYGPGHTSHKGHIAVPLDQIPGYDGSTQQWCTVCKANGYSIKCTFACVKCSDRHSIVAVHLVVHGRGI